MKTSLLVLAALPALLLGACASDHIVVAHGSVWGVGAEGKPDGTAAAAIGAVIGDAAAVPYVNKKTGGQYTVPTMCGGQDAVSVLATVNGTANNGGAVGKPLTLSVGHDLAVGEPARLAALAAYQQAAGPGVNAIAEWHNCAHVTPPSATAGTETPAP